VIRAVYAFDVPVREVRVIGQLAGGALVYALAEHDAEADPGQEASTFRVDGISCEAEHIHVIARGYLKVAHGEYASGIHYHSHG
jgi:hypothetical protein